MIFSKSLSFSIIAFLALIILFCLSPWTPKYPISAKLVYQPKLLLLKAPLTGVLINQNMHVGDELELGKELFDFKPLESLVEKDYQLRKLKELQSKLRFYEQEIPIQKKYFERLTDLFHKKLIAAEEYQQKKLRYFDYIFKKQDVLQKISTLKHQQLHHVQAPMAGKVLKLFGKNEELIYKGQKIAIIQPQNSRFKLLIQVPVRLQAKIFIGQTVRLAMHNQARFRTYPILAHITEISPILKKDKILIIAEIQKPSLIGKNLYSKLPMDGYLLGPTQAFWKYLRNGLMGESC